MIQLTEKQFSNATNKYENRAIWINPKFIVSFHEYNGEHTKTRVSLENHTYYVAETADEVLKLIKESK